MERYRSCWKCWHCRWERRPIMEAALAQARAAVPVPRCWWRWARTEPGALRAAAQDICSSTAFPGATMGSSGLCIPPGSLWGVGLWSPHPGWECQLASLECPLFLHGIPGKKFARNPLRLLSQHEHFRGKRLSSERFKSVLF